MLLIESPRDMSRIILTIVNLRHPVSANCLSRQISVSDTHNSGGWLFHIVTFGGQKCIKLVNTDFSMNEYVQL